MPPWVEKIIWTGTSGRGLAAAGEGFVQTVQMALHIAVCL